MWPVSSPLGSMLLFNNIFMRLYLWKWKKNVIKLVLLHFSKAFVFCIVLEYEEVAWGSQGLEPALPQECVMCIFT